MRYAAACVSLALCVFVGKAWADDGNATVYGAGAESCGRWLASSSDQGTRLYNESWVLGWLSAAGHYNVHGPMQDTDADAVSAWLDSYCKEHPLDSLHVASAVLVRELSKRAKG